MRADRLVSLVLLLRQRGRMSAAALAAELEVSVRTVLRDIDALSSAGVPVYAERGRYGGFALLPGFRTELTGLTPDEAVALLAASARAHRGVGLGSALASATRKVADALPEGDRARADAAARRFLVDPDTDLLARRRADDEVDATVLAAVRAAVVSARRLRMRYAAAGEDPRWRSVDPIGLVTVRGLAYLLARRDGDDRTYRLSRVLEAEVLDEPADRPAEVDLERMWRERSAAFRSGGDVVAVRMRLAPGRLDELAATALAVRDVGERGEHTTFTVDGDGTMAPGEPLLLEALFQDLRHAEWATWNLGDDADVHGPAELRAALHRRAAGLVTRYAEADPGALAETAGASTTPLPPSEPSPSPAVTPAGASSARAPHRSAR